MAELTITKVDPILHDETRFALMAVLVAGRETFTQLESSFKITPGNLSSHLSHLERAGYVTIKKRFVRSKSWRRKPCTTIEATPKGIEAFKKYLSSMRAKLEQAEARIAESSMS